MLAKGLNDSEVAVDLAVKAATEHADHAQHAHPVHHHRADDPGQPGLKLEPALDELVNTRGLSQTLNQAD